MRRRTH
ncbi:hypothetical protein COCON_G00106970 [Conger conger]|nr:hypothetical protein COCON_G00106970 [Conger conger]